MFLPDTPRPATRLVAVNAAGGECREADGLALASPGDVVTCSEGHPVYRVMEPIRMGERPRSSWFKRLDNDQPPAMGVAPRCPKCGQSVFQPLGSSGRFGLFINGRLVGEDNGEAA